MPKLFGFFFLIAPMFAQDAVSIKAGDRAPAIDWTRIVRSPDSAPSHPNLAGQFTVLEFLPNVTTNAEFIARRNELIAQFKDKPVHFVWIASEPLSAIEPFLHEHPMSGYLLIDEHSETAHAYGCQLCSNAIVDPSGNIVGFTSFLDAEQLSGILDGKAVAMSRETDGDEALKLLSTGKVRLDLTPERFEPHILKKPDIPASYEVHISPSTTKGTDGSAGSDFWVQKGFSLRDIASVVYEKDASRMILPKELDDGDKFDFTLVLPKEEDEKTIHQLVQRAIEKHFKVTPVIESKPTEVYVMTAIKGKTPPAKIGADGMGGGSSMASSIGSFSLPAGTANTPEAIEKAIQEWLKRPEKVGFAQLSAHGMNADDFRQFLERGMDRPIVDETGLTGVYDFEVKGNAKNTEESIRNLREQVGVALTRATRNIEYLVLQSLL